MSMTTITAAIDAQDKQRFEAFCASMGLDTSTAINLFIKAVLREKRIPFEISLNCACSNFCADRQE